MNANEMKYLFLLFFLLAAIAACHNDTDIITGGEIPTQPEILITTKIVTRNDTNVASAMNATQTFGGESGQFDQFPYLSSKSLTVDRDYELLTLRDHQGLSFFHIHDLVPNDVNYIHWKLPELQQITGSSSFSTEIVFDNGASALIPSESLLKNDGSKYEGSYTLHYGYIDPYGTNIEDIPSFTGYNNLHKIVSLQFDQCYYITAISDNGTRLEFSEQAKLRFPPTSPTTQWQFDEFNSAWKNTDDPSDQINLGNSIYYGTAQEADLVRISGQLMINGNEATHQQLIIQYGDYTRRVYTSNKGEWALQVPAGINCTARVELPCTTNPPVNFTTPQHGELNVPINITATEIITTILTGTITNCDGIYSKDGMLIINGSSPTFYFPDQQKFTIHQPACINEILEITAIDPKNAQMGPSIKWNAADTVNLFSVFACEAANGEYFSINVAGDQKMYWDLLSELTPQSRILIANDPTEGEIKIQVYVTGMNKGEYSNEELNIVFEDMMLGNRGYSLYCPTSTSGCGFTSFTITHFPEEQGKWIRGHFEGNFWIKTFNPLTAGYRKMTGEFQVEREF